MASKRLLVLTGILGVGLVAGAVVWYPKIAVARKTQALSDRFAITSSLKRAARSVYKKTGKWPKSIADLKGTAEVKELGEGSLNGVSYDLLRQKGEDATYVYANGGKRQEIVIAGKTNYSGPPPTLSGVSTPGG